MSVVYPFSVEQSAMTIGDLAVLWRLTHAGIASLRALTSLIWGGRGISLSTYPRSRISYCGTRLLEGGLNSR